MSVTHNVEVLYPFGQRELDPQHLKGGIEASLQSFESWRDTHPEAIAAYVDELTGTLDQVVCDYSAPRRIGRLLVPRLQNNFDRRIERDWVAYFGLHNLGEALDEEAIDYLCGRLHDARELIDARQTHSDARGDLMDTVFRSIEKLAPELQGLSEMNWLEEKVARLGTILPENVMQAGGLGKVVRTIMGVLAIGVYDVRNEPFEDRQAHLQRVIPGAYILGSTYALVDDTLQSNAGSTFTTSEKDKIHKQIVHGLSTGEPINTTEWLDHPLVEELSLVYDLLTKHFPFDEYRHLYHAIEAMYLAQRRDSLLTPDAVAANGGIRSMYPDMAIKAAMTRVVANIFGRSEVPNSVYKQILNSVFISQLRDDFQDRFNDWQNGDCTPFSLSRDTAADQTNPLYDLFAFEAYRANVVWGAYPTARRALLRFDSTGEIAPYISKNPQKALNTLYAYPHTPEIARFIWRAIGLSEQQARLVKPRDMQLEALIGSRTMNRDPLGVDARTFVSDRVGFLNETINDAFDGTGLLEEVANYSLSAGGKRLRPALTLMLAEALGVPREHVKPLVQTIELIHTSSLILDDLPAQDNATKRRGRPTAHVAHPEWAAQLASVAMISRGFGVLANLREHFPADRVAEVVRYADIVLGFGGLCQGQTMDLGMDAQDGLTGKEDILQMYVLKTSLAISAALVPLMILAERPRTEIDLIDQFATSAGIVFQIRDDILDMTASAEQLGKDTSNDVGKKNIARSYGLAEAERILREQKEMALACCKRLPFDTRLLEGVVDYFATRKK